MTTRYSRTGRPRPAGGTRVELAIWYLMRITGLMLFVLALTHFLIVHVLYDPADQTAAWIAEVRWSSTFWRVFDWTLLMSVLIHAFIGVRTVVADHAPARARGTLIVGLALVAAAVFAMGTAVVLTMQVVPKG